jgi:hypothetical protein
MKVRVIVGVAVAAVVALWLMRGERQPPVPAKVPLSEPNARGGFAARPKERVTQQGETLSAQHDAPSMGARDNRARLMGRGSAEVSGGAPSRSAATPEAAIGSPQRATSDAPADTAAEFETLKAMALSSADPDDRIDALSSISRFDEAQALPVFIAALSDRDRDVRLAALEELGWAADPPPLDVLATVLNDTDPELRLEALKLIGDSDDPAAAPLVQRALHDPDEDVRSEAEDIAGISSDLESTDQ